MGTSKAYSAPTTPQWSNLKGDITRSARNGPPTPYEAGEVLSRYVSANGGPQGMAGGGAVGGGQAAQRVARSLGGFISTVGNVGLQEALRREGIADLEGESTSGILFSLLNKLGGSASTIDDVDARNALSRLLDELLENAEVAEVERILQEQSGPTALQELLSRFFGFYLYEQFCRVFYERLVERVGEIKAATYHSSILDYIKSALKRLAHKLDITRVDWAGNQGATIANRILQDTLEIFGHAV